MLTRTPGDVYRFGPFELDTVHCRLVREGDPVALPDRHINLLVVLASHAGHVVSKESLIEHVWHGVAVTDNSIERGIWNLRRALGHQPGGAPYIETLARLGYRFAAAVERTHRPHPPASLDALLAPYRAFVDGRAALETFNRDALAGARQAFEEALRDAPDYAAAHIGMANACVLAFEATRADAAPDLTALHEADRHAREACRLDPSAGDAWSTLAFVLNRRGDSRQAIAAARKAAVLEPDDWRHHVRLAFVSWGEERLHAARRAASLCPRLALAHWFAATVFVARQALDPAIEHLRIGCAAQDAQRGDPSRFHAVGLHLLHGLVLAARGASDAALEECFRELALEDDAHIYGRECGATTWYAVGALRLRQGHTDAEGAFHEALRRVPGHTLAEVGLAALSKSSSSVLAARPGNAVDAAMAKAAALALNGQHDDAASLCGHALALADPGPAGWLLPVEPLINVAAHQDTWEQALATLRHRAA